MNIVYITYLIHEIFFFFFKSSKKKNSCEFNPITCINNKNYYSNYFNTNIENIEFVDRSSISPILNQFNQNSSEISYMGNLKHAQIIKENKYKNLPIIESNNPLKIPKKTSFPLNKGFKYELK